MQRQLAQESQRLEEKQQQYQAHQEVQSLLQAHQQSQARKRPADSTTQDLKKPKPGTKAYLEAKLAAALQQVSELQAQRVSTAQAASATSSAQMVQPQMVQPVAVTTPLQDCGARFDPTTGAPIPKFDPTTGKQNWWDDFEAELETERHARRQAEERMRQMVQELDSLRTHVHGSDDCEATASMLAFRQYVATLLKHAGNTANKERWKLRLRQGHNLVDDVFEQLNRLSSASQMWRKTVVTFVNEWGSSEPGLDEGGLTASAHASFWRAVFKQEHGLFEVCRGEVVGSYLPCPDADETKLELVGRFLLKSVLDNHPIGSGLGSFAFEFLCDAHEWRTFARDRPLKALQALAEFDPQLSKQWEALLSSSSETLAELTRDMFDEELFGEEPLSPTNVAETIVAGCRRRLFLDRRGSLEALKRGFTFKGIDLSLQLAAMPSRVALLLTRGRVDMSAEELMRSFDWDVGSTGLEPRVAGFLKDFIRATDRSGRLRLLRWCTGQNALPADGLKHPVTLLRLDSVTAAEDLCLPLAHTCAYEVELPAYSSSEVLREKLTRAMDEMDADGGFEIA